MLEPEELNYSFVLQPSIRTVPPVSGGNQAWQAILDFTHHFEIRETAATRFLSLPGRILLFYAATVLLAILVYPVLMPEAPYTVPDSRSYMQVAADLADNGMLDELALRPPGYPLLLVFTGSTVTPQRSLFYAQLGLHFVATLVAVVALYRLNVRPWLIYGFMTLMVMPFMIMPTGWTMSESLTEFYLATGTMGLVLALTSQTRIWRLWVFIAAAALSLSGLTRPTYQLAPFLVGGLLVVLALVPTFRKLRRRLIGVALTVGFAGLLLTGGYIAYNAHTFNYTGITPLFGFNLSTKTWRMLDYMPEQYRMEREVLTKYRDQMLLNNEDQHQAGMFIWNAIPELQRATGMGYVELSRHMQHINVDLIKKHPIDYLKEVLRSSSVYWFPSTEYGNWSMAASLASAAMHGVLLMTYLFSTILLVCFSIFFVSVIFRMGWQFFKGILPAAILRVVLLTATNLLIFYTVAISVVIETGNPRYRTPTDLLILLTLILSIDTLNYMWNTLLKYIAVSARVVAATA